MNYVVKAFCLLLLVLFPSAVAYAGPGDILFSDDFDSGATCSTLSPVWTSSVAANAGINTDTSASPSCSLFTGQGPVTVTSQSLDLSGIAGADLTAWVRKGDDAFSENPDNGEDLVLEYRNSAGFWISWQFFSANALANGAITIVSNNFPLSALHSNFALRWRQTGGSGANFDFWHIDDVVITESGIAPPPNLNANFCDRFENGLQNFTANNSTFVGTGNQTSNSPNNSLFLRHGTATATSVTLSATSLSSISVWVRRGDDSFSENPDNGENLIIEAFNNLGVWVELETFAGLGTQGEIFNRTYTPTADLMHPDFQIRFRLTTASGSDFDYWHVDDLCFVSANPNINVQKTSQILSDPINGLVNPKAIPGAIVRYLITITNTGEGIADDGSVSVTDTLDANTTFFSGDLDGSGAPFIFTDGSGSNSTGLSVDFSGLGSSSDGVAFFNGANSSITPSTDFDAAVRALSITLDGPINGTTAGGTPSFQIEFNARIE